MLHAITDTIKNQGAYAPRSPNRDAFQGRKAATVRDGGLSALPSSASTDAVRQSRIGPLPPSPAVLPHTPGDHAEASLGPAPGSGRYSPPSAPLRS